MAYESQWLATESVGHQSGSSRQSKEKFERSNHLTLEIYSTCGRLFWEAGQLDEACRHLGICPRRRKKAVWNKEGVTRANF
jgi:hypothetical protein